MSVSRLLKAAIALGADVAVTITNRDDDTPGSLEVVA